MKDSIQGSNKFPTITVKLYKHKDKDVELKKRLDAHNDNYGTPNTVLVRKALNFYLDSIK